MANPLKAARVLALAVALLSVPIMVDTSSGVQASAPVRLSAACAQATGCKFDVLSICSTIRKDHRFYRCSSGCDEKPTEEEPSA